MRKRICTTLAIILLLISLALFSFSTSANKLKPRITYLREDFYWDPTSAWSAFVAGEADIHGFTLTLDQIEEARNDFDIILAPIEESNMFQFDINNNHTILDYPGWRSPTSYVGFRRALARLTDKDFIVETIFGGFAERLDVPLPAPLGGYFDPSGLDEYPYAYDPVEAANELDAAGFVQGTTDNPWYDPEHPGSAEFIRTYPPGHEKEGQDLDPVIIYARADSTPRFAAAEMLRDEMLMAGIPVDFRPETFAGVYGPVFTDKNYHIYTGGWDMDGGSLGRFPTFLWLLYHSKWWVPGVPLYNYVTGKFANGTAVHPEYDEWLDGIWFADTFEDVLTSVQESCEYHFNQSVTIPLWSTVSYWAYRKPLISVVNMDTFGIDNDYTFLNVRKPGSDTVVMALVTPPVKLNPLYTSDRYGWQVLDRIYSRLMSFAPYDVYLDQPWVAQDWVFPPGTWFDEEDNQNKTKLTWWFRKDSYFGNGVQFTAEDYLFSMWYTYAYDDAWQWKAAMDIHHIELVDLNNDGWLEAEVYMNELNMWLLYSPTFPLLPKDVWLQDVADWPLATKVTETVSVDPDTGEVQLTGEPVYVESVDGLERFTEWNLFLAPNAQAILKILVPSPPSTVTVTYWDAGIATGYTPGDLPFDQILIGNGLFNLIDLEPGAGGFALLERNPYRTEEVPVGEIDWYWYWVPGEAEGEPWSGYYRVDDADLTIIYSAWDTRGDGVPDGSLPPPEWFPGADISAFVDSYGVIDPSDVGALSPNYGVEFGHPPSSGSSSETSTARNVNIDSTTTILAETFPINGPTVFVDPPSVNVNPGDYVTVTVKVFNLTDATIPDREWPLYEIPLGNLWSFHLVFTWDPSILEYVSHTVTIPVETYLDGILHQPVVELIDSVNSTAGTYELIYSSMWPAEPFNNPNATNKIFNMTFKVIGEIGEYTYLSIPPEELSLTEAETGKSIGEDVDGDQIYLNIEDGYVEITLPTVGPSVFVEPQNISIYKGKYVTITIKVFNLTNATAPDPRWPFLEISLGNLYGFHITLSWDPTILEYVNHTVTIPIEIYPDGILHEPVVAVQDNVNVDVGEYKIAYTSNHPAEPFNNPNATNLVFNMTFKAINVGNSSLNLAGFKPAEVPKLSTRGRGRPIGIGIRMDPIYLHSFDGLIEVKIPDINGDGIVDVLDLFRLGKAFGSEPSDPNWDEDCDLDSNGIVDDSDLSILAEYFGGDP